MGVSLNVATEQFRKGSLIKLINVLSPIFESEEFLNIGAFTAEHFEQLVGSIKQMKVDGTL